MWQFLSQLPVAIQTPHRNVLPCEIVFCKKHNYEAETYKTTGAEGHLENAVYMIRVEEFIRRAQYNDIVIIDKCVVNHKHQIPW